MRKFPLIIASLVLTLMIIILVAVTHDNNRAPHIMVDPVSYNYGNLSSGKIFIRNFTIKNTGGKDLLLGHVYASCCCNKVRLDSKLVKPGQKINMRVFLDTNGKASGVFTGNLEIESNDPDLPRKLIMLTANIVAENGRKRPPGWRSVSAEKFYKQMKNAPGLVLVDVRTAEEYREGHIAGSILIPLGDLSQKAALKFAAKNTLIVVYCRSGQRSEQASRILTQMGYTRVYDLGGICSWPYEVIKTNQ